MSLEPHFVVVAITDINVGTTYCTINYAECALCIYNNTDNYNAKLCFCRSYISLFTHICDIVFVYMCVCILLT